MSYLGNAPISGSYRVDYFSGTGSATTFNLSYPTGNEASVIVSISGVVQQASTYSLMNGQIIFTQAPPSGTNNIEVRYLGDRLSVTPYLSADTYGIIRINANIISENVTITTGYNGSTTGPVQIANGKTVYISTGSTWKIL